MILFYAIFDYVQCVFQSVSPKCNLRNYLAFNSKIKPFTEQSMTYEKYITLLMENLLVFLFKVIIFVCPSSCLFVCLARIYLLLCSYVFCSSTHYVWTGYPVTLPLGSGPKDFH